MKRSPRSRGERSGEAWLKRAPQGPGARKACLWTRCLLGCFGAAGFGRDAVVDLAVLDTCSRKQNMADSQWGRANAKYTARMAVVVMCAEVCLMVVVVVVVVGRGPPRPDASCMAPEVNR